MPDSSVLSEEQMTVEYSSWKSKFIKERIFLSKSRSLNIYNFMCTQDNDTYDITVI